MLNRFDKPWPDWGPILRVFRTKYKLITQIVPDVMPQISILIPYDGIDENLETTLVSVLENRPNQCEIIVAHRGNYDDPYDLADEVRFVELENESQSLGQVVSEILPAIDAPILHLLACGIQVSPHWTAGVLEQFDDAYVGSACPILLDRQQQIHCVGIENSLFYHNRLLGQGQAFEPSAHQSLEPVGPSQLAAYYRAEALGQINCLDEFSTDLFGLDVALSLEAIGFESRIVPTSVVELRIQPEVNEDPAELQKAIWRYAGSLGFLQGISLTGLGTLVDLVACPFSAKKRSSLFARLANLIDLPTAHRFREFVDQAIGPQTGGETVPFTSYDLSLQNGLENDRRAA